MKRKGFTLVELLTVIAIIALLMSILMPVLSMVRKMAQRAVCGSNLGGIHKSMLAYAEDNDDDYPRAGGRNSTWGETALWDSRPTNPEWGEHSAFGEALIPGLNPPVYGNGRATIGASLYLLIREADVGPKSFVCRGDKGVRVFSFTEQVPRFPNVIDELRKAWDFGPINTTDVNLRRMGMYVAQYYSYAYHIPYLSGTTGYFQMSMGSRSGLALMADRSPYIVITPDLARPVYEFDTDTSNGVDEQKEKWGNSANHDNDGQNVLFNDGSVLWRAVPYCGINNDNIYTIARPDPTKHREAGWLPNLGGGAAASPVFKTINPTTSDDSVLVNEGGKQGNIVDN
jgi:prepilin-type N-terminal cleavage/methylation domain-containing protein